MRNSNLYFDKSIFRGFFFLDENIDFLLVGGVVLDEGVVYPLHHSLLLLLLLPVHTEQISEYQNKIGSSLVKGHFEDPLQKKLQKTDIKIFSLNKHPQGHIIYRIRDLSFLIFNKSFHYLIHTKSPSMSQVKHKLLHRN